MKNYLMILSLLFITNVSFADVLHVPDDFATIQTGIDSALNGDTVLVADGTYSGSGNRNISFHGKSIIVQSENGPETCVIDCEQSTRAFKFDSGETAESQLLGFTITNGGMFDFGGGIYIESAPVIRNCRFISNSAYEGGGGIFCRAESDPGPEISNCTFRNNSSGMFGGGIACNQDTGYPATYRSRAAVTISECALSGNSAGDGGGISVFNSETGVEILNCTLRSNAAGDNGGGIYCENAAPLIRSCLLVSNHTGSNGGAICAMDEDKLNLSRQYDTNGPTVVETKIVYNHAHQGGGLYADGMIYDLQRSIISGNTGSWHGGGLLGRSGSQFLLTNCLVSGNTGDKGAGFYIDDSRLELIHCTVANNGIPADNGTIYLLGVSQWQIVNSIITGNRGIAVINTGYTPGLLVTRCLFHDNPDGDYYDVNSMMLYNGAHEINLNVPEALDNIAGDPLFISCPSGNWTETPLYDPVQDVTILTDTTASFNPGGLEDKLLNPNTIQPLQALIAANTATTITVLGDVSQISGQNYSYQVLDYHISNGSAGLDRAKLGYSPVEDFDADPRPGPDGTADIGLDEAESSFQPPADPNPPISYVTDLPSAAMEPILDIQYLASDAESGVGSVELYYQFNGGDWTQYGSSFTQSPISFAFESTGGTGYYSFYTIAVDLSGNRELPPETPDGTILYTDAFPGDRIYVDQDASGSQSGLDWENALHSVKLALEVAAGFSVPEIWVAEGVYEESIEMYSNISMYGGFQGTETLLSERNWDLHPTILDAGTASGGDPAPHVVRMDEVSNIRLDGFTLTGGFATGVGEDRFGGGIFIRYTESVEIFNCSIHKNYALFMGGGVLSIGIPPMFVNCDFTGNTAAIFEGGGLHMDRHFGSGTELVLINCRFSGNRSNAGGGLCCNTFYFPTDIIWNCLFVNNTAAGGGGGIYTNGKLIMTNTSFFNNTAGAAGGAVYIGSGIRNLDIQNCILWGNSPDSLSLAPGANITYCNIQDGYEGEGNIDADPLFVPGPFGDYYLSQIVSGQSADSPCIDSGSAPAYDIEHEYIWGNVKMSDLTTRTDEGLDAGTVDMGYHYFPAGYQTPTPTPSATPTPYCETLGVTMYMPATEFHPDDICTCTATVCNNTGAELEGYPLFVILDAYGMYFFAPSFNTAFDHYLDQHPVFPMGETVVQVLDEFHWPNVEGSGSGIKWYSAMTNPEMTELFGEMHVFTFGWSE